jgi:Tol biopolymer transport system component
MSPEQLEGKDADTRTDIFALGTLLYEMATGHRAFTGDSQASLIAAIMGKEPRPISEMIPMSPPALDRVVKTCMAKDPDDRWQTAHDVALQLVWIAEGGSQAGVPAPVAARRRHRERLSWIVAGIAGLAAIVFAGLFFLNRSAPGSDVVRFQIQPPPGSNSFTDPKISPDGRFLAFNAQDSTGTNHIWIRRLSALEALPLPGTEDAWRPFWSPDSRYLGYLTSRGKVKKVAVQGGPPQPIGDAVGFDGTWGETHIVFDNTATDTLQMIPAGGGLSTPCSSLDPSLGETGHVWPYFLPDGKHYLFLAVGQKPEDRILKVGEIGSMESRVLGNVTSRFEYVPSGHLLYVRDGTLLAHPFDVDALEFSGDPVPLAENVTSGSSTFGGSFSVSQNGILTYWEGSPGGARLLHWTDREGNELEILGEAGDIDSPALSPDEQSLMLEIVDSRTSTPDLWMRDLTRGTVTRMTFDPAVDIDPVWSPDGKTLVFSSRRTGDFDLYTLRGAGGGLPDSFYTAPGSQFVTDWSADGKWIIFQNSIGGENNLMAIRSDGSGEPLPIATSEFAERQGKLSPDGKWIAYQSRESGSYEVYVQAFPEPSGKWQISTNGGLSPQWQRDGKELFYLSPELGFMVVSVNSENGFLAGVPERLFTASVRGNPNSLNRFQVTADGQRFLFNAPANATKTNPVTVVMNWISELEKR